MIQAIEIFPEDSSSKNPTSCLNADLIKKARDAIERTRTNARNGKRVNRRKKGEFGGAAAALNRPGRIVEASADTRGIYEKRGGGLFERYKHELQLRVTREDFDPCHFVIWLLGARPFWQASSWRSNRAAALKWLESTSHVPREEALAILQSRAARQSTYLFDRGGAKVPDDGASARAWIPQDKFEEIKQQLPKLFRSELVSKLEDWMIAGIFTGVGPDEWRLTKVEGRFESSREIFLLHVIDVDVECADGPAQFRTLDLSSFAPEAREAVARMADSGLQWTLCGNFAQKKSEVSAMLRKAGKALFPRSALCFDLESLQHQFVANMQTVYSREEISALIGELFIQDRPANYANRRRPWRDDAIPRPIPPQDHVDRFRKILAIFKEQRTLRELKLARRRLPD